MNQIADVSIALGYTPANQGQALSQQNPLTPVTTEVAPIEEAKVSEAGDERILALEEEQKRLTEMLNELTSANKELKEQVSRYCSSPSQKRLMLSQLERNHGISRRNACRLLGLARSTCWYKSESSKSLTIRKYMPRTPISMSERIRLLSKIAHDVKNSQYAIDEGTVSFCEVSLKQLGLNTASAFARSNLRLSMEIFEVYVSNQDYTP